MKSKYLTSNWLYIWVGFLFLIGLISRILPLFDFDQRLLQQFPTEDGYLMLTIARNLAIGLGMSTSDGTISTNGVQPLSTLIWSLGYYVSSGDKILGVAFSHLIQLFISIAIAYFFYRFSRKVFKEHVYSNEAALVLAAMLFSSPHFLPHTMNFLETGMYLLILIIVLVYLNSHVGSSNGIWTTRNSVELGVLLGLLFWVRNDSVFLIFAICVAYLFTGQSSLLEAFSSRLKAVLLFGVISVLVASPWLIYNYTYFGSIVPVSGRSEGIANFGENIWSVPSALFEYIVVFLPIPRSIQNQSFFVIISMIAVGVLLIFSFIIGRKLNYSNKLLLNIGYLSIALFVGYYGLFFGAEHFISRYMIPISPFLMLLSAALVFVILDRVGDNSKLILRSASVVILLVVIALNVRIYMNGIPHQHSQVVNWVEENVSEEEWVGAIQTGTLGYFHDRTINLDGKVNPEALAARLGERYCVSTSTIEASEHRDCLLNYVVQQKIPYLVDWKRIAGWIDYSPIKENYKLVVSDEDANLGVLVLEQR